MKTEIHRKPVSGYGILALTLIVIAATVTGLIILKNPLVAIGAVLVLFLVKGFVIVSPNHSAVMTLFGEYKGTIRDNGFFWVNPFYLNRHISLRARNQDREPIKVNDKMGNPVMIGAVLVWQVEETFKSAFEVDNFENFVSVQSESAVRRLASMYPYDKFDDAEAEISLRDGGEEVNKRLEHELQKRLNIAGIKVIEARISYLAYASEIAGAMLQRQQATAVVAARKKIVEGAVGMVEMALEELSEKKIVSMDDAQRADMVSNLMVVLCSERSASPVVNV